MRIVYCVDRLVERDSFEDFEAADAFARRVAKDTDHEVTVSRMTTETLARYQRKVEIVELDLKDA